MIYDSVLTRSATSAQLASNVGGKIAMSAPQPLPPVGLTAQELESKKLLELLETRSYETYKARLRAAKRLAARNNAWNATLIAVTASTLIASIGLLVKEDLYGDQGATLFVCLSVLTLTASLVTSGLDYSGRSRDMFSNYRRIQRLSAEAERAASTRAAYNSTNVSDLNSRYDELLDGSENHTEADYYKANNSTTRPLVKPRSARVESLISFAPYGSLLIPFALAIPLVGWIFW